MRNKLLFFGFLYILLNASNIAFGMDSQQIISDPETISYFYINNTQQTISLYSHLQLLLFEVKKESLLTSIQNAQAKDIPNLNPPKEDDDKNGSITAILKKPCIQTRSITNTKVL